jgi:iron complex transport system substrate-binding protein
MHKRISLRLLFLLLAVSLFLSGCNQPVPAISKVKPALNLPESIVCTNIWSAEILFELVDASRIKGLSAWNDQPTMTVTAEKAKAVKARVSLMPDLVIIDSFSDPDGALTKTLTGAGAVVLSIKSPTDFAMISESIRTIAKAVGAVEQGERLVAEMNQTLASVNTAVKNLAEQDRLKVLFYEAYYDQSGTNAGMLAAYGEGSTFSAIARAAGMINVCNASNYSAISKEKIVGEWKPDILVVPAIVYDAKYEPKTDTEKTLINAVLNDPLMKSLPAIKNKQVLAITEAYRGSTSQYMAKAVEELARVAYPKLFA